MAPVVGSKGKKNLKVAMVLLHIKLEDSMQANILPLQTLLTPLFGPKGQIVF